MGIIEMPPNPYQIDPLIEEAVTNVIPYRVVVEDKKEQAKMTFLHGNFDQQYLAKVTRHLTDKVDRLIRCACPTEELMMEQFPPVEITEPMIFLAVDGSQAAADRRRRIQWSLTNVASVAMQIYPECDEPPTVKVNTELYLENTRITLDGISLTNESIDLLRDVREREWLGECVSAVSQNSLCCGMLDSGLEIWAERPGPASTGGFKESLSRCIEVFSKMKEANLPYIGYVQSGGSELLVRLLEIAVTNEKDLPYVRKNRIFENVLDTDLLDGWLRPGFRSAIYELRTRAIGAFKGELSTFFFYLNVGNSLYTQDDKQSCIVRVELPAFLRTQTKLIGMIQSAILKLCRVVPGVYSPYVMIRADEEARISRSDQNEIQARIETAYIAKGLRIKPASPKNQGKDLT
jgi:hypothetical protein